MSPGTRCKCGKKMKRPYDNNGQPPTDGDGNRFHDPICECKNIREVNHVSTTPLGGWVGGRPVSISDSQEE